MKQIKKITKRLFAFLIAFVCSIGIWGARGIEVHAEDQSAHATVTDWTLTKYDGTVASDTNGLSHGQFVTLSLDFKISGTTISAGDTITIPIVTSIGNLRFGISSAATPMYDQNNNQIGTFVQTGNTIVCTFTANNITSANINIVTGKNALLFFRSYGDNVVGTVKVGALSKNILFLRNEPGKSSTGPANAGYKSQLDNSNNAITWRLTGPNNAFISAVNSFGQSITKVNGVLIVDRIENATAVSEPNIQALMWSVDDNHMISNITSAHLHFTKITQNSGESYNDFLVRVKSSAWQYGIYDYGNDTFVYVQYNGNTDEAKETYQDAYGTDLNDYYINYIKSAGLEDPTGYYEKTQETLGNSNALDGKVLFTITNLLVIYVVPAVSASKTNTAQITSDGVTTDVTATGTVENGHADTNSTVQGQVKVLVTDKNSGSPMKECTVTLNDGTNTKTATSGDDGYATFDNLPEGTYVLNETVVPTGYDLTTAEVSTGSPLGTAGTKLSDKTTKVTIDYTLDPSKSKFYIDNDKLQYTVTYDPNGGSFAATDVTSYTEKYGDATTEFAGTVTAPTGKVWIGWNKDQTQASAGTKGNPQLDPSVTQNQTYYAVYRDIVKCPFNIEHYYQQQDGTYKSTPDQTVVKTDISQGEKYTATSADYIAKAGWSSTPDGSQSTLTTTIPLDATTADKVPPIKLYYPIEKYTITYMPGTQGTFTAESFPNKFYDDTTPATTVDTTKCNDGYHFTQWSPAIADKVTGNQNYTAQWAANGYKITFDGSTPTGGATADEAMVYDKEAALNANGFTKTGYTFQGWSKTQGGTTVDYTDVATVKNLTAENNGTVTLYAVWKVNTFKIHFDGSDPTSGTMTDMDMTYDVDTALTDNAFVKTGATFLGWSKTQGGTTVDLANGASAKNLTAENGATVNLYAVWQMDDYQVSYSYEGTIPDDASAVPNPASAKYNDTVTVAPDATATGYTFSGWSTTDATISNGTFSMPAKPVALKGSFTPNTYTIKFDGSTPTGGTMDPEDMTYGTAAPLTANTFTKDGFTFQGWSKTEGGTTVDYADSASVQNLVADNGGSITLYAVWGINSHTVAYSYDGQTPSDATALPASASANYNDSITVAPAATATGYTFSGWSTTDATISNGTFTMPDKNVTLKGSFTANSYKIHFDSEDKTSGDMADQDMTYDVSATLTKNTYAKTGNDFLGWATTKGAAAPEYTDGQDVKNLATEGTVTLYPVWKVHTNHIIYNLNGGTNDPDNPDQYTYGQTIKFNDPKKGGSTFKGWYTDATFKNRIYGVTATDDKDLTLYAKWVVNDNPVNPNNGQEWCVTFLDCKGNTVGIQWVKTGGSAVAPTGFGTYSGYTNVNSHRDLKPTSCAVTSSKWVVPNTSDKK